MIDFTQLKTLVTKFTVTGAQKAHIERLIFELGVQEKEAVKALDQIAILEAEAVKSLDRIAILEADNSKLQSKLKQIERSKERPGNPCPYCSHLTGELLNIQRDPVFGDFGIKNGEYECTNCGKSYEKEMPK